MKPTHAAIAALLLLAGCGSGLSTSGSFDAAGSGTASTLGGVSGYQAPGPAPTATPSRAQGGAFCQDLRDQLATVTNLFGGSGPSGDLTAALAQARAINRKILRDAPAAVRGDVEVLIGFSNRVIADLTANPPNLSDISKLFADPAYRAASANAVRYATEHCGNILPPQLLPGPPTT